ncbi:MAG: hypothetical protein ACKV22_04245 [Bryobacteraceae bacterium]
MRSPFCFLLLVLSSAAAQDYKLVRSWGETGDSPSQFRGPHGICIDGDGNVIVTDSVSHRVARFSPQGRFLSAIGKGPGAGDGEFSSPRDCTVDRDGRIFVSDGGNHRIEVFGRDGVYLRQFGQKGSGDGQLLRAHALEFDALGRLFVADVDKGRIDAFDNSGKFLFAWGKEGRNPGEFHAAHGLGIGPRGSVIVSNYYGPCQKFTADGKFLFDFAPAQPPDGPVYFHSMTTDSLGNVYLTARTLHHRRSSILKYDSLGKPVTQWSLAGDHHVEDVAVDISGTVYATFRGKQQMGVEVYSSK